MSEFVCVYNTVNAPHYFGQWEIKGRKYRIVSEEIANMLTQPGSPIVSELQETFPSLWIRYNENRNDKRIQRP